MHEAVTPLRDVPARTLGGIDATCVVIGAIIGVGIFFSPSQVAALTGTPALALLAWSIAGVIALCGALTFAELGARYSSPGAQYEILRDTYGAFPAFLFVFCNATAVQAGATAIIGIICAENIAVVARSSADAAAGPPSQAFILTLSAALILGVILANAAGVKWGARIQNLTVFAKVFTLLAVTAIAIFAAPESPAIAAEPIKKIGELGPFLGVLAALVPILFAFGGWQHALWISGEVKNPRTTLPRSILVGVCIVVAVYLLANWAYLHLLGVQRVADSKALAADAVATVFPAFGGRVIAAAVALSAFGVLNAQLLSGPRLVYAMARDGRFFSIFGTLHPRLGTPLAAIAMLGGTALILLFVAGKDGVDKLTTGVVFIDTIFFALTGIALLVLRKRAAKVTSPDQPRPEPDGFRVPLYPFIPLVFIIGEVGVLVGAYVNQDRRDAAYIGIAWLVVAAILYLVMYRRR